MKPVYATYHKKKLNEVSQGTQLGMSDISPRERHFSLKLENNQ